MVQECRNGEIFESGTRPSKNYCRILKKCLSSLSCTVQSVRLPGAKLTNVKYSLGLQLGSVQVNHNGAEI